MTDKWFALAAVALGGLIGFLGTFLVDLLSRRERRATRWDETRARAYAEFAAAVKTEIRTCDRIAASRGFRAGARPLAVDQGMQRLEAEQDRRTTLIEQVLLLGSQPTASAARAWQASAWAMHEALVSTSTGADEEYLSAFQEAAVVRDRFYAAARRELDVRGGSTNLPPQTGI